jgi:hypothetical protein
MNTPDVQNSWFTRVLLYWDKVHLIVPYEMQGELNAYTNSLKDEELVDFVDPSDCAGKIPLFFKDDFLQLIDKLGPALVKDEWVRLHEEKNIHWIFEDLEQRRLLRRSREHGWMEVKETTANLYMSHLATHLSKLDKLQSTPITDDPKILKQPLPGDFEASRLEIKRESDERLKLLNTLTAALGEILPGPTVDVSAHKIADFKEKYDTERKNFKDALDEELRLAAGMSTPKLQRDQITEIPKKINKDITALEKRMHDERWEPIKEAAWASLPTAATFAITGVGLPATVIGVTSAMALAAYKYSRVARRYSDNPFAYAVTAKQLSAPPSGLKKIMSNWFRRW